MRMTMAQFHWDKLIPEPMKTAIFSLFFFVLYKLGVRPDYRTLSQCPIFRPDTEGIETAKDGSRSPKIPLFSNRRAVFVIEAGRE